MDNELNQHTTQEFDNCQYVVLLDIGRYYVNRYYHSDSLIEAKKFSRFSDAKGRVTSLGISSARVLNVRVEITILQEVQ